MNYNTLNIFHSFKYYKISIDILIYNKKILIALQRALLFC